MLFGEYEKVEEFLAFLCKACFVSFSFAHRIVWFLKSLMNPYNPQNERIRTILHLIQTIFKSENKQYELERLHIAGSKKFIEYLQKNKILPYYGNHFDKINSEDPKILNNRRVRELLNDYIDKQYNNILKDEEEKDKVMHIENSNLQNHNLINEPNLNNKIQSEIIINNTNYIQDLKLESVDIFINTFKRYDSVTNDENNINIQYVKQIDMDDINLSSFLSNINFVDHLCNICEILRSTPLQNQNRILLNELRKVNKVLPANIYLPFINDSIRNYIIASIPLTEIKIFKTKNRAPFLVTLECFRLDELTYNLMDDKNKENIILTNSSNSSSNDEDDNLKSSKGKLRERKNSNRSQKNKNIPSIIRDDISLQKNPSIIKSLLHEEEVKNNGSENKKLNRSQEVVDRLNKSTKNDFYVRIKDTNTKSFIEPSNQDEISSKKVSKKINKDNKFNKTNYLLESDVNISKPVVIKNILNTNNRETNLNKKSDNNLLVADYETYPEDYKKIENVINNNFKKEDNKIYLNLSQEQKVNNNDNQEEQEISIRLKNKNIKKDEEIDKNNNLDNSGFISQEENNDEIILSTHKNEFDKDIIFGEKIEDQTERLKKSSPFGSFNTYKLFKIIVKSGEDLRQEQFATQLINEFYQIFKIEKVDCWVNSYEIVATGNNVGIIEVVPNSVSLDQLRKNQNISSLKNFYDVYYAPVNSDRYKKAMKNFISSLAGYSLVCYFLQIKDRHNGNILIDDQGRIIHIDFGFMLSNAPGKGIQFEKAPFKLTKEFVDAMGGVNSKYFTKFRKLLWKGFIAIVNNYEKILILVEMMYCGHGNKLPCFERGHAAITELRSRFIPRPNMKTRDYIQHVDSLIEQSIDNWRTKWYDKYQYWVQGIFY